MSKNIFTTSDSADLPKGSVEITFEGKQYIVPASCIEKDATTSSGPGGQHVNKTQSKARMTVDINDSLFPKELREKIMAHPDFSKICPDGIFTFESSEDRSWHRNIDICAEKLRETIRKLLVVPKKRKKIKPPYKTPSGKKKKIEKAHKEQWRKRKYDNY